MNVDPASLDTKAIATYTAQAQQQTLVGSLLHIIPSTFVGAFAEGDILQVLFLAILFAFALHALGERGQPLLGAHRPDRARLLRHRRHRHVRRADRRVRRHGVHDRQVRRRARCSRSGS